MCQANFDWNKLPLSVLCRHLACLKMFYFIKKQIAYVFSNALTILLFLYL